MIYRENPTIFEGEAFASPMLILDCSYSFI
jgi:hypothetical protein